MLKELCELCILTFIVPITTAADDKIYNILPSFQLRYIYFMRIVCHQNRAVFETFEKAAKFEIVVCCKL